MSEAFIRKWKDTQKEFTKYYESEWNGKVVRWVKSFRKYRHANQQTNGGVERWHATLKLHLRMEKPFKRGRKIVWLVTQLVSELEHFYWCMSCMKWQGRVRNKNIENYVWAAILKARNIPDEHVIWLSDGKSAQVRSQTEGKGGSHMVQDYESPHCLCTCSQAVQGNMCKHQVMSLSCKLVICPVTLLTVREETTPSSFLQD